MSQVFFFIYANISCMSKFLNLNNARKKEQIDVMKQIIKDGVCPFCRENLEKYHTKPIIFETKNWVVTENAWPYNLTKKHYLVINQNHIEHSSEITDDGWFEIKQILEKLEEKEGLKYGTLLMRFGDTNRTGATVNHLHFQIIQADENHPDYKQNTGLMTRIG
jgi:ATP adenylyltransferase